MNNGRSRQRFTQNNGRTDHRSTSNSHCRVPPGFKVEVGDRDSAELSLRLEATRFKAPAERRASSDCGFSRVLARDGSLLHAPCLQLHAQAIPVAHESVELSSDGSR